MTPREINENQRDAERLVAAFVGRGDLIGACHSMAAYEASQPKARGIGINWKQYDPTRDVRILRIIAEQLPGILMRVDPDALAQLRAAAMHMYLWGKSAPRREFLPRDLCTGIHLSADTAARMMVFFAQRESQREHDAHWLKDRRFRVVTAPGCCPECAAVSRTTYSFDALPEFPFPRCSSSHGCRCRETVA